MPAPINKYCKVVNKTVKSNHAVATCPSGTYLTGCSGGFHPNGAKDPVTQQDVWAESGNKCNAYVTVNKGGRSSHPNDVRAHAICCR